MFSGEEFVETLNELRITHVVTVPDSTIGQWQGAIRSSRTIRLISVCREGEAWHVAAGLWLGGARPLVLIQCTGLFESGDALRNALFDYRIPLPAIIGYRSYLDESTLPGDTARIYTEPVLKGWGLDSRLITDPSQRAVISTHLAACAAAEKPGIVLIAEGRA